MKSARKNLVRFVVAVGLNAICGCDVDLRVSTSSGPAPSVSADPSIPAEPSVPTDPSVPSDSSNPSTPSGSDDPVPLDVTPPIFTSLNAAHEASDLYVNSSERVSGHSLYVLTAEGYSFVDYTAPLLEGANTCDASQNYDQAAVPLISVLDGTNASYVVCVRLRDATGNTTYGKSQVVTVDTIFPVFTSLALANDAMDAVIDAADLVANLPMVSGVVGSDYVDVKYVVDAAASSCSAATFSSATIPKASDVASLSAGNYKVCVLLVDEAGNKTFGESPVINVNIAMNISLGSDIFTSKTVTITPTVVGAVSVQWSVSSANATDVTFSSPTTATTNVTTNGPGVYVLRLTATNAGGSMQYAEINLNWTFDSRIFAGSGASRTTNYGPTPLEALANADAICQARADAANFGGTFRAILSTFTNPARAKLKLYGKVRRLVDYFVVADFLDDLWDGNIDNSVRYNDLGVAGSYIIHSGTGTNGYGTGLDCSGWSHNNSVLSLTLGMSSQTGSLWLGDSTYNCNSYTGRTYCFEVLDTPNFAAVTGFGDGRIEAYLTVPADLPTLDHIEVRRAAGAIPPDCNGGSIIKTLFTPLAAGQKFFWHDITGTSGANFSYRACFLDGMGLALRSLIHSDVQSSTFIQHKAFITSTAYTAGSLGGLAGADALCQAAAIDGNLTGEYRALLSTSTVNAASRFTIVGAVRTARGTKLVDDATDLWDGSLDAAFSRDEFGNTVPAFDVWTGSTSTGTFSGNSCNDWTSSSASDLGASGLGNATTSTWIANAVTACDQSLRLMCVSLP